MSRPSIKKILNDFESYNHSSIQPLPPIKQATKNNDEAVWENKQLSLGDLGTMNVRKSIEKRQNEIKRDLSLSPTPFTPRSEGGYRHEFYINQEVPTTKGYIPEPLFELTKKDAFQAQTAIQKEIVNNDMINFKSINLDTNAFDNNELDKVLYLIKNEISLFHNNNALLNRFFGGYTEYLDHLTKSDEPIDNTILADKGELNDALSALKKREDEALDTIKAMAELEKELPPRPVIEVVIQKEVEPKYMTETDQFIELGLEIQRQIDKSDELSNELKSMSSWNPKLEENLILEEQEIESKIKRIETDLRNLKDTENLEKIHEMVVAEKEKEDRGSITKNISELVDQIWPNPNYSGTLSQKSS